MYFFFDILIKILPAFGNAQISRCFIELAAYGYDDKNRSLGFIKVNGQEMTSTTSRKRGFTLARLGKDCKATKITTYDTYASNTATSDLRDYLQNLSNESRVIGITHDSYFRSLGAARPVLTELGISLEKSSLRTSLGIALIKGRPKFTKQTLALRYQGPALLSAIL